MFKIFNRLKSKIETDEEIKNRVLGLCEDIDCGIFAPPMDAQVALNELKNHLLGENWYSVNSLHQSQINTEIVYEIERKYKRVK